MSRFPAAIIASFVAVVASARAEAQQDAVRTTTAPVPNVAAPSRPAWRQDFETAATSWIVAGGDAQHTIVAHQRVRGSSRSGQGSEWVQVAAQGGSTVFLAHDVGRPTVIDELRPAVWIYSDRPGLQFLAEVTLPRTADPKSGKPLTTAVFGSSYTTPGRWQQLEIANLPVMVARQVRVLRSQLAMNVDGREAYVSRLMLNVFGGAGVTNVWIDDLEVHGHVASTLAGLTGAAAAVSRASLPAVTPTPGTAAVGSSPTVPRRGVKLAGSVLKVNDYPIFPRAVEYRGERLAFLRQLGFNTIWLTETPSPAFLAEARQLGLWIVCPPPPLPENEQAAFGPEYEPVLVWDMGHGLTGDALEANRRRAERVRLADSGAVRPLICSPVNNLRSYSRHINLLLIDRRPLGTSLEMPDYGTWVRRQPLLALPGTPVWTTVQTRAGEGLRRQFAALSPGQSPPSAVGPEQIRLLVYTAISSGSRGLLFLSDSTLEAGDAETRQRAMSLQLLNLELEVVEPWVAGGTMVAMAESSQRLVTGAILRDDRARIVMPMWLAPGSQCVAPLAAANPLILTLPGIPESSNLFELTAGRLQPLRHRREAGGTRVMLDDFGLSALLFLAQDTSIIEAVTRRAAATGRQTAQLERYLAAQKLDTAIRVYGQIGNRLPSQLNPAIDFDAARTNLTLCDMRLASGDFAMASSYARRAMMPLRRLERAAWEAAMKGLDSPVAVPGTSSFQALPWHWALADRAAGMRSGGNRLPGGDFENIEMMVRSGWRHFQHAAPGIQTAADLVPDAMHSGRLGLRLTARPNTPENPPATIEMPPLWVTSPAVQVQAGQIVRIHGWVDVPSAFTGSVDGLLLVESLTGEEMALRIDKTTGWREFTMLRIAPQSGPMVLTLAMTGLGEIRLDDLTVEILENGPAPGQSR